MRLSALCLPQRFYAAGGLLNLQCTLPQALTLRNSGYEILPEEFFQPKIHSFRFCIVRCRSAPSGIFVPGGELFGNLFDLQGQMSILFDADVVQIVQKTQSYLYAYQFFSRLGDQRELCSRGVRLVYQHKDIGQFVFKGFDQRELHIPRDISQTFVNAL